MLQVVSVRVSVTSLSLSFRPSVSQTVDWYGNTRLRVFIALPQMGPWQHVRDQNVLYLSCQAVPRDQNGPSPLGEAGTWGLFSSTLQIEVLIVSFGIAELLLLLKVQMGRGERKCKQLLCQLLSGSCGQTHEQAEVRLQAIQKMDHKSTADISTYYQGSH